VELGGKALWVLLIYLSAERAAQGDHLFPDFDLAEAATVLDGLSANQTQFCRS
jgi:hypothetical protein